MKSPSPKIRLLIFSMLLFALACKDSSSNNSANKNTLDDGATADDTANQTSDDTDNQTSDDTDNVDDADFIQDDDNQLISISKTPKMNYQENSHGCRNISVYKFNDEGDELIAVDINSAHTSTTNAQSQDRPYFLVTPSQTSIINISEIENDTPAIDWEGRNADGLDITITLYKDGEHGLSEGYCSDYGVNLDYEPDLWVAVEGMLYIDVTETVMEDDIILDYFYTTIRLNDVVFKNAKDPKKSVTLKELIFKDVYVGWLPG